MNKFRTTILLVMMVLVLIAPWPVSAQGPCPQGSPPTPEQLVEIEATHGSALLKFCPQYIVHPIPTTSNSYYFRKHQPPTVEMIVEISRTRGAALMDYWKK